MFISKLMPAIVSLMGDIHCGIGPARPGRLWSRGMFERDEEFGCRLELAVDLELNFGVGVDLVVSRELEDLRYARSQVADYSGR